MKKSARSWLKKVLKEMAENVLAKNEDILVIGITGSVGKSSTKEAIYTILNNSKKYKNKVKKSGGNLNNEVGMPLSILGFTQPPANWQWPFVLMSVFFRANLSNPLAGVKVLVLEYAADRLGDIKYLTNIVKPNIAVITKIDTVHTQYFGDVKNVAKEKSSIANKLKKDEVLFLDKSSKFNALIKKQTDAKIIYFSVKDNPPVDIAKEVAKYLSVPKKEIDEGVKKIKPLPRRLNIIKGVKGTEIIDDTYNASPESMKRALSFLKKYKSKGRKIAVLGAMLELGKYEDQAHKEVLELAKKDADLVVAIGVKFQKTNPPIWFMQSYEAAEYLLRNIEKNDIILVKGSNAMRMDLIVSRLRKER